VECSMAAAFDGQADAVFFFELDVCRHGSNSVFRAAKRHAVL
jgi:hypothetical protein